MCARRHKKSQTFWVGSALDGGVADPCRCSSIPHVTVPKFSPLMSNGLRVGRSQKFWQPLMDLDIPLGAWLTPIIEHATSPHVTMKIWSF